MKKTVLLTGASGFIGSKILSELLHGPGREEFDVVVVSSRKQEGCRTVVYQDSVVHKGAFKQEGVERIDLVIHAGAFTPKNRTQSEDRRNNLNVLFTDSLLQALPTGVKGIVFLSSLDVYKPGLSQITEESPVSPSTLYGWSKLYGEEMIKSWARSNGAVAHVLRIGHIYGPGEMQYDKLIPNTIKLIMGGGAPVLWNEGSEKRSFLYIDDCVSAIMALVRNVHDQGLLVNVASDQAVTVKNVVETIIRLMRKDLVPQVKKSPQLANDIIFDTSLMKQLLYTPQTGLTVGLQKEIEYFQNGR